MNLDTCPNCGGPADNGHDRCVPPTAYLCSACMLVRHDESIGLYEPTPQEQKVEPPVDGQSKSSFTTSDVDTPDGCGPSLEPVARVEQNYTTNMLQLVSVKNNLPIGALLYSADTIAALTKERNAFQDQCIALKLKHHEQIAALQAEIAELRSGK